MGQNFEQLPSEVQQLVGMVSKTVKLAEVQAAWPLTLRVPFVEYAEIRTLAEYSGRSINQLAVHVLRVGLKALQDALPAGDQLGLDLVRPDVLRELYKGKGESLEYREGDLS
jgi:hypothetical protein